MAWPRVDRLLQTAAALAYRRFWLVITMALVITLVALYALVGGLVVEGGPTLRVNTDLSSLLPEDYPSVRALNEIRSQVAGVDKLEILIQSDDFAASLRFAEDLIPRLLHLRNPATNEPYIANVEYRNDIEFFERNRLLLADIATLQEIRGSVDDRVQREKNRINPLFVDDLFGAEPDESADGDDLSLAELEERYEAQVPSEYLATNDGGILMLRSYPFGTSLNLQFAQSLYASVEALIAEMEPSRYHPSMFFELGGEVRNRVEEYRVVTTDALRNLLGGMTLQVLLIVLFFRQPLRLGRFHSVVGKAAGFVTGILRQLTAALLIAVPLVLSIIWTFAIASVVVGGLNTITVFLFVILFGLGIDFGIHTYSRYLESRLEGEDVLGSLEAAVIRTGSGIVTAAVTTAAAFYALVITDFKGFSDFGFIAGTGILASMAAMLLLLPSFVTLGEKLGVIRAVRVTVGDPTLSDTKPIRWHRPALIVAAGLVVLVLPFVPHIGFEYNFRELRANLPGLDSVKAKIHDLKMDAEGEDLGSPAVILADNREDLVALVEVIDSIRVHDTDFPTVHKVESIFDKFPQDQAAKLEIIRAIRTTVDEEALDLVTGEDRERLLRLRGALDVDSPFTLDDVPLSIKRKFVGNDGTIGNFVFVYPSVLLRDGLNSIEFARDLRSLSTMDGVTVPSGRTYFASSGSVVAADMLLLMQRDSAIAITLTSVVILIALFLAFRTIKRTVLVAFPLLTGFAVLWAIQLLFGVKYNLFNMVVLPVFIGYGVDGAIHLLRRYLEEGVGSVRRVLKTTGWAVVMTTLTTSAGFAGLIFVRHGGLQSMGKLAVTGLMVVMVATLVSLPAALRWLEVRGRPPEFIEGQAEAR
jgi:predicted RND superfamily exporter protein